MGGCLTSKVNPQNGPKSWRCILPISNIEAFGGSVISLHKAIRELNRDFPKATPDFVYLTAETRDNEDAQIVAAGELNRQGRKFRFGICGHDEVGDKSVEEVCGTPGFTAWKKRLRAVGIDEDQIIGITDMTIDVGGRKIIHTLSEHMAVDRWMVDNGVPQMLQVSPYWHLPRSFLTALRAGHLNNHDGLRVYPLFGAPLAWHQEATGPQGAPMGIRANQMLTETVRIYSYCDQGNLAFPDEGLAHLELLAA